MTIAIVIFSSLSTVAALCFLAAICNYLERIAAALENKKAIQKLTERVEQLERNQ